MARRAREHQHGHQHGRPRFASGEAVANALPEEHHTIELAEAGQRQPADQRQSRRAEHREPHGLA